MTKILYMPDIESNYIKEFDSEVVTRGDDHVVLDRTAFYPEGGGQPSDTGILSWDDEKSEVKKVEKKGKVIHRLEGPVPDEDTKVTGKIDWERRYSHMKLHTSQHLFSAVVYERFRGETAGNQINPDYSRVDFEPVELDEDDFDEIENEVNEMIDDEHPISIYEEDRDVLENKIEGDRVNLSLLPKSIERLRVIDIDGIDICPCAGTHVRNTKEIDGVEIYKTENKGKKRQRIYYELKK